MNLLNTSVWDKFNTYPYNENSIEPETINIKLLEIGLNTQKIKFVPINSPTQVKLYKTNGKIDGKGEIIYGNNFNCYLHNYLHEYFINGERNVVFIQLNDLHNPTAIRILHNGNNLKELKINKQEYKNQLIFEGEEII